LKILVTYFSQSGNTEKVAQAICEGCQSEEVEIEPIKDVDPSSLSKFDLVFLGSGIYASRVNKSLPDLIDATTDLPPNFAFFCSHASLNSYQDGFKIVKRKIGDTSNIIAEFDCCGDNIGIPEAVRKRMLESLPEDKQAEAKKHQDWLKGRPNDEDLQNVRNFAKELTK
jgi:flavodoxin